MTKIVNLNSNVEKTELKDYFTCLRLSNKLLLNNPIDFSLEAQVDIMNKSSILQKYQISYLDEHNPKIVPIKFLKQNINN